MSIEIPPIDARRFEDLRDELLARIPSHTPEWTHHNASDPGVALLELFAFLGESILYRANRIPERNRLAFLRLLGVALHAGTPARAMLQFAIKDKKAVAAVTLPTGLEVKAGRVAFHLDRGLDVLPVTGWACQKVRVAPTPEQVQAYRRYYAARMVDANQPLELYQTQPLSAEGFRFGAGSEAIDGAVWVALLAAGEPPREGQDAWRRALRAAIGERVLSIGFVPEARAQLRSLPVVGTPTPASRAGFRVEAAVAGGPDGAWGWLTLQEFPGVFAGPGAVEVVLPAGERLALAQPREALDEGVGAAPPALVDARSAPRLLGWLRLVPIGDADVVLRWVGLHAATCTQGDAVHDARVGVGNGEPDQSATLASRPVVPGSLRVWVGADEWSVVDDIDAAPREGQDGCRAVQVDWQEGTLRFGNGLAGARPPVGAPVRVGYAVNAGPSGNVPAGAIQRLERTDVEVANPVAAAGGTAAEDTGAAERQVARWLQHRDRCVTAEDFRVLVQRTPGVQLARVEVLPAFHPRLAADRPGDAPGCVTILVLPPRPVPGGRPEPGDAMLAAICAWLEPRRLVTTELFLTGPSWVPVVVSVGIEVTRDRAGSSVAEVRQAVLQAIATALSPVPEGNAGGWALGRTVRTAELMVVVAQVPGVQAVTQVLLGHPSGAAAEEIPMRGLQLPWLAGTAVNEGSARPLAELASAPRSTVGSPALPVPLLRDECR